MSMSEDGVEYTVRLYRWDSDDEANNGERMKEFNNISFIDFEAFFAETAYDDEKKVFSHELLKRR